MGISYWDLLGSWGGGHVTVRNKGKGKKIVLMQSYDDPFAFMGSLAEHPLHSWNLALGLREEAWPRSPL